MTHSLLGEAILIFFFGKYCDSENLKCKQQLEGEGGGVARGFFDDGAMVMEEEEHQRPT